ncbi:MAG TPA: hotdog domain-containing protein [Planctomycetota bacterium]|nr:hotdog domain-containing protein [Planctomycetota bacterium]
MRDPAIRVVLLPRDTNAQGSIFGGVILSHLDLAGAVEARKNGHRNFVTVLMRQVEFKQPVFTGDVVSFYTSTLKLGTTSVTVRVDVEAQRQSDPSRTVHVTEAEIVYVAVDAQGRPIPVKS